VRTRPALHEDEDETGYYKAEAETEAENFDRYSRSQTQRTRCHYNMHVLVGHLVRCTSSRTVGFFTFCMETRLLRQQMNFEVRPFSANGSTPPLGTFCHSHLFLNVTDLYPAASDCAECRRYV